MPECDATARAINPSDLEWKTCRSGGKGGQNANKLETAVQLRHIPTGVAVRCETERSQYRNRQIALAILTARLQQRDAAGRDEQERGERRAQIGSGMRGDKIRTIRVRDDAVNDHVTGRKWKFKDYARGIW